MGVACIHISALRKLVLVQLSSAVAERAFSFLLKSFPKRPTSSLEDYVQLSVMPSLGSRPSPYVRQAHVRGRPGTEATVMLQ